jgi:hypothetical protein
MISAAQVPHRTILKTLVCVFAIPIAVFRPTILVTAGHDYLIAFLPQRLGDSKYPEGRRATFGKAERTRVRDPARDLLHDFKVLAVQTSGVLVYVAASLITAAAAMIRIGLVNLCQNTRVSGYIGHRSGDSTALKYSTYPPIPVACKTAAHLI